MKGLALMRQYVLLDGLRCVECGRYDQPPSRRWRAYHGRDEPEDELEVFVFCPDCSQREFLDCEDGRFTRRWPPSSRRAD